MHAVCRENVFWETLESLKSAGASALLVLPVEKMLRLMRLAIHDWSGTRCTAARAALLRARRNSDAAGSRKAPSPRSSPTCAHAAMPRSRELHRARYDGVRAAPLARRRRRNSRRPSGALTAAQRAALDRAIANVAPLPRGAAQRAARARDRARACAASASRCRSRGRPLRAGGLGAAALDRHHARGAGRARRLSRRACCARRRGADGGADPAVLVAAQRCGISDVFKIGGAQAIAAMAYGTGSVPKVDKIFGPGNAWVTAAKQQVARRPGRRRARPAGRAVRGAGDRRRRGAPRVRGRRPAGAGRARPGRAGRAGHDLATPRRRSGALHRAAGAGAVAARHHERRADARPHRPRGRSGNGLRGQQRLRARAPDPRRSGNRAAGSRRCAPPARCSSATGTPEALGDYCSGTNHVLPTYGYARAYSGLSLADFTRRVTVQELTLAGLAELGPVAQDTRRSRGTRRARAGHRRAARGAGVTMSLVATLARPEILALEPYAPRGLGPSARAPARQREPVALRRRSLARRPQSLPGTAPVRPRDALRPTLRPTPAKLLAGRGERRGDRPAAARLLRRRARRGADLPADLWHVRGRRAHPGRAGRRGAAACAPPATRSTRTRSPPR